MTPEGKLGPGSIVGILGGGQLGRMLALAAARLGLRTHVYSPETRCPAAQVTPLLTVGDYDDVEALAAFASSVDVVTYEFENVPVACADICARHAPVRPGVLALKTAQDRWVEKTTLGALPGVEVAPFAEVDTVHGLRRALAYLGGGPCVLKTRRFGYDGKGQAVVRDAAGVDAAWETVSGGAERLPCILEGFVAFTREVSIVAARGLDGSVAAYPLTENVHRDHILHTSRAPADGDRQGAQLMARTILESLEYCGVMAVELFDTPDGLIVNEIAPRVHNSGHWTQDAGCTDQFEQHIRAVCGWPLGQVEPGWMVEMTNLIGADVGAASELDGHLHLYGKREARPGRKMGHVNRRVKN